MKSTANTATKTTATAPVNAPAPVNAHAWSFAPKSITVNGQCFDAGYSIAKGGDVYVFAQVGEMPVRIHVGKDMPEYADCLAAAKLAREESAAEAPAAPAPAPAPAPVDAPAKPERKTRKAKPAPAAENPAPAVEAPAPAPVAVTVPASAPVNAAAPIGDKSFVGTTITGKGWNITFDEQTQRTRVLFQAQPTQAQLDAINAAGFYWSAVMGSFNKKLSCKAYRAAQQLAATLNALA